MKQDKILTIPAIYEGSRDLKDRTKKLIFNTNEVTPEQAGKLQKYIQQFVYLLIKVEEFNKDELDFVMDLKSDIEDIGKTPSQRMRAVLYKLWEQNNEGYEDFNLFYNFKMENFISHLKTKII